MLRIQMAIIRAQRELYNDGLKVGTQYWRYSWKKLARYYLKKGV